MASSHTYVSSADAHARLPTGVRLLAAALALLAIAGGILTAVLGLLGLSLAYMDSSNGVPTIAIVAVIGLVAVPVVGLLAVARRLWRGAGWARLTTQIVFLWIGQDLMSEGAHSGVAPANRLIVIALASGCIAAIVYLESPKVRVRFGLEPQGLIGRHLRESVLVAVALEASLVVLTLAAGR